MKTQELMELASLDALGLLEEPEREAFDRTFRAAPPALQAQIRREQARIAQDDSLLPIVDAPIGLKAMVMARWLEAMTARKRFLPPLLPSSGVSPFWRMGAISAVAASVVLAAAMLQIQTDFKRVVSASNQIEMSKAWTEAFGPTFSHAFYKFRHVGYQPADGKVSGDVVLLIDPEHRSDEEGNMVRVGELYVRNFPASAGAYQIALVDGKGDLVVSSNGDKMTVLTAFTCSTDNGSEVHLRITVKVEQIPTGYGLAIVGPGEGNPVLGRLML
ncbi:MAG: hypothetical protein H7210_05035 [Pyrinomonadaceae bacterium]|nr:hypothetical protein [Phycisphaerales bacterium]